MGMTYSGFLPVAVATQQLALCLIAWTWLECSIINLIEWYSLLLIVGVFYIQLKEYFKVLHCNSALSPKFTAEAERLGHRTVGPTFRGSKNGCCRNDNFISSFLVILFYFSNFIELELTYNIV